ncbi:MAG: hypothetical protein PF447_11585 [Spirochaetaceae bacterium]|nr:hypothetical protein [Spirochaetaceae bacterium]
MSLRPIKSITKPQRTSDGAGVALDRVFGQGTTVETDPFLMMDHLKTRTLTAPWPDFPGIPTGGLKPSPT